MFEQHPVPQQISSYQFRLVGDMTLKQFFQLAAGAVLGLLVYASPLPSLFRWPLIIFFVIAGAAFAFLPLQERPLEEWISAFFRAVYGPTLYQWKKDNNISYFASTQTVPTPNVANPTSPVKITDASVTKLETKENTFLSNLTNMFTLHPKTAAAPTSQSPAVIPQAPIAPPLAVNPVAQMSMTQAQIISNSQKSDPVVPRTPPAPTAGTLFVATPVAANVATPRVGFEVTHAAGSGNVSRQTSPVSQTFSQSNGAAGIQAQFSPDAAPPSPATIPNVIVGQVMTSQNKIVEGAILEVKDFQGRPVRALKTNKAGHFMIVTPLPNGKYQMSVEKEGLVFDPLNFEVHGTIIEPMAVKAKQ